VTNSWVEHAIWWHVYPLGFLGADTTGADRAFEHRLPGLERWFDHLARLGANGLALGPIFDSASHGYDTIDHLRIDPRLGDEADFGHLVEAAHARGIRVLLDGVFNHVGRDFAALRRAEENPAAPENAWFRRAADGSFETFEGHDALVALNHDEPAVADYVVEVMNHWLARGADGWRLDAAYATPAAFWRRVLPRVRAEHPDAYVFGEVLHGDYPAFVEESGVDSVTQYELWKAIWSSIESGNFFELDWALQRHNDFLATFVPYTFVGNHDVTRIASQITDARHHAHALVALMAVGGTPAVYYGDEIGLRGVKEERIGGDDAIRPAFPSVPEELGGEARAAFELHQRLIGVRRRHPWLHRATTHAVSLTNLGYVFESAASEELASGESAAAQERLVVALNLADEPLDVESDAAALVEGGADRREGRWVVPPHGWVIVGP
jgi:cyclomaltodextrinase